MDRAESFRISADPYFLQLRSALFDVRNDIKVVNYIYGLGGRDVVPPHIEKVFNDLDEIKVTGKYDRLVNYLGVRE